MYHISFLFLIEKYFLFGMMKSKHGYCVAIFLCPAPHCFLFFLASYLRGGL